MLWVNVHGGFIVGFLLLGGALAGELMEDWKAGRLERRGLLEGFKMLVLAALAVLVNPWGYRVWLVPFQHLGSPAHQTLIAEWASPDFHQADLWPFLGLMLTTMAVLALSRRRVSLTDLILFLGFTAMALRSGRFVGLACLVMAPLLGRYGAAIRANWRMANGEWRMANRKLQLVNWLLLAVVLLGYILKVTLPLSPAVTRQAEEMLFPTQAVDYLLAHDLPRQMFNSYNWGGYLTWRLYPRYPVFIDGRADVYGDDLLWEYYRVITLRPDWDEILRRHNVNLVLIEAGSALAALLEERPDWQRVYVDEQAVIFVRGR